MSAGPSKLNSELQEQQIAELRERVDKRMSGVRQGMEMLDKRLRGVETAIQNWGAKLPATFKGFKTSIREQAAEHAALAALVAELQGQQPQLGAVAQECRRRVAELQSFAERELQLGGGEGGDTAPIGASALGSRYMFQTVAYTPLAGGLGVVPPLRGAH